MHIGEKCVRDEAEDLAFDDRAKKEVWVSYYSQLLNKEFDCV